MAGGGGNDTMSGGSGSDVYIVGAGDGSDVIQDNTSASDVDTLVLNDVDPAAVTFNRAVDLDDLILVLPGVSNQVLLDEYGNNMIEQILFDDGTVWLPTDLQEHAFAYFATSGNDTIYGFNNVNDTL